MTEMSCALFLMKRRGIMSGNSQTGAVLGATTSTAAGIAILPNTNGNIWLVLFAGVLIAAGLLAISSFAVMKLVGKFSNK